MVRLEKPAKYEEIVAKVKEASEGAMKGVPSAFLMDLQQLLGTFYI